MLPTGLHCNGVSYLEGLMKDAGLTCVRDKPRSSAKTTFFFLLVGLAGSFSSDDDPDDDPDDDANNDDDTRLPSESDLDTRQGLLGLASLGGESDDR